MYFEDGCLSSSQSRGHHAKFAEVTLKQKMCRVSSRLKSAGNDPLIVQDLDWGDKLCLIVTQPL